MLYQQHDSPPNTKYHQYNITGFEPRFSFDDFHRSPVDVVTGDFTGNALDEIAVGFNVWKSSQSGQSEDNVFVRVLDLAEESLFLWPGFDFETSIVNELSAFAMVAGDIDGSGQQEIIVTNDGFALVLKAPKRPGQTNFSGLLSDSFEFRTREADEKARSFAIAGGDFTLSRIRYTNPRRSQLTDTSQPWIILKAPPTHFDIFGDNVLDVNNCFGTGCGFRATLTSTETEGTSFTTSVESDWSVSAGPENVFQLIAFALPGQEHMRLEVYDLLGRRVALLVDEVRAAGQHTVDFDATALTSGVYLYRITAGDFNQTRKMLLMK